MKNQKVVKTRAEFNNAHLGREMLSRLKECDAIDLRQNHRIDDLKNGYSKITVIDPTKKF